MERLPSLLYLTDLLYGVVLHQAQALLDAYVDSVERILGAPPGSLQEGKPDDLREWWGALRPEQSKQDVFPSPVGESASMI